MKARLEPFGAWVKLQEPPVLVAVEQDRARQLGLDGGALWSDPDGPPTAPLEVHLAVNSRCGVGCEGCYLDATPQGVEPPFQELVARLEELAAAGVFTVAFGGGEPLLRRDLGELAREARRLGLTPVMTTSATGLTAARARELTAFAQVNVSHDGVEGGHEWVRGGASVQSAERAIGWLVEAGIKVGVNLVLTRHTFQRVEATANRVAFLGAREIQLLRYKPAGRAASASYLDRKLTPDQIAQVPTLLERLVTSSGLSVRIDCAMVPWLSMSSIDPVAMELLGVFGCEAGRHLAASTVEGQVAPCSFLKATELPTRSLQGGYRSDPGLVRLRCRHESLPEPCASCPLRRVCRGGCEAVASWYGDSMLPDPECPRVVAWREVAS
ncbi:MAG: radical SAM protein [Myxococcales bacterium]|nr:radical SAM protein [Polyangiaceae bacterium]MDW8248624.1 radical SAM protein [Myxococcales bacterium]